VREDFCGRLRLFAKYSEPPRHPEEAVYPLQLLDGLGHFRDSLRPLSAPEITPSAELARPGGDFV
jgi:hypothetical protein